MSSNTSPHRIPARKEVRSSERVGRSAEMISSCRGAMSSGRSILTGSPVGWREIAPAARCFPPGMWYVDHTEAIAEYLFLEVSQASVRYLIERPVAEHL